MRTLYSEESWERQGRRVPSSNFYREPARLVLSLSCVIPNQFHVALPADELAPDFPGIHAGGQQRSAGGFRPHRPDQRQLQPGYGD